MKKANQNIVLKFKDYNSMSIGQKVLEVAFNFLDKENNYDTKTITSDAENYHVNVNISLHGRSEVWKLNECLELFQKLDIFIDEEEEEESQD